MNVNADEVAAVLSPIVAGAASLARRLAASKAAANGATMPPAVADEVAPALGPVSPLDVSLDSQRKNVNFYYLSNSLFYTLKCLAFI